MIKFVYRVNAKMKLMEDFIMKKKLIVMVTLLTAAFMATACSDRKEEPDGKETVPENTIRTEQSEQTTGNETMLPEESAVVPEGYAEEEKEMLDAGDPGVQAVVADVMRAVADKDQEALAGLCSFPVYFNGEEIADQEAFMKLDADKLFTEKLLEQVAATDVKNLPMSMAGTYLGSGGCISMGTNGGSLAVTFISAAE